MPDYCTASDVASFLGLGADYFTSSDNPTQSEVEAIIEMQEDFIDNLTHHAWRESQANSGKYEYHTMGRIGGRRTWFMWLGFPIYLKYRRVKQFDSEEGDAFDFYNGKDWEDWLTEKTEGTDYWVDYDNGIVFVYGYWRWIGLKDYSVRFRYRYGEPTVPKDIKLCTIMLTAMHLVTVTDRLFLLPEGAGTGAITAREKIERWKEEADTILEIRREFVPGGD